MADKNHSNPCRLSMIRLSPIFTLFFFSEPEVANFAGTLFITKDVLILAIYITPLMLI
ncbi:hypothetical protein SRDD_07240 [Serratia sp. DD3]|nr:hypothetical protein SRDD_07240 [Serratia sp. DD3]